MGLNSITALKSSAIIPRILNKKETFISRRFLPLSSSCLFIFSLRSKRPRTTRTKLGPREGVFSHSGCTKNEARAKKWTERRGGGKRRERLPANPSIFFYLLSPPHPAPSTFLLSPHFSRGIVRIVQERQPRSQGLSSLPPLVVGRKTPVAAGHVTTCDTNYSTGVESTNNFCRSQLAEAKERSSNELHL